MSNKKWTKNDIAYLVDNYGKVMSQNYKLISY